MVIPPAAAVAGMESEEVVVVEDALALEEAEELDLEAEAEGAEEEDMLLGDRDEMGRWVEVVESDGDGVW